MSILASKIPTRHARDVEIVVEAIGDKPPTLNIEISVIQGIDAGRQVKL
jgi:hypothetical protein